MLIPADILKSEEEKKIDQIKKNILDIMILKHYNSIRVEINCTGDKIKMNITQYDV